MTLEEWRHIQAVEPATRDQLGAIMRECDRLGFGAYDRAERLAICARIIGLETLRSTKDLRLGEAGQLVHALMDCRSRAGLPVAAAPPPPVDWPAVIIAALIQVGLIPVAVTP